MKKKLPYFPFYPADFLSDLAAQDLTLAQCGAYVILLCHDWLEAGLPLSGSPKVDKLFKKYPSLKHFFKTKKGKLRNPRLEKERQKRKKFCKSMKTAGVKGAKKRWLGHEPKMAEAIPKNASSSSYSSSSSNIHSKTYVYDDDDMFLVGKLLEHLERINPNLTVLKRMDTDQQAKRRWANSFRLMREQDKHSLQEIGDMIDCAMKDEFWRKVILSPDNLRKHWDKLVMKRMSVAATTSETSWQDEARKKFSD